MFRNEMPSGKAVILHRFMDMTFDPTLLYAGLAAVYAVRVAFFFRGVMRERRRWTSMSYQPTVSIVVPARNEEANIERCVRSLMNVKYPAELLEIVVVDDRSKDRTPEILDRLAMEHPSLKVLHRTDAEVDRNLRGKPGALQYGIDQCRGEIILMTDADCVVPEQWVSAMAAPFHEASVAMVNAMTSVDGPTVFDRIQDVEWTYTQTMACGGVGNDVPLGCFGNNLAIRSSVFHALGGYLNIPFSVTEDMALQLAVEKAGHDVRFVIRPETSVVTQPCATFQEYVKQRHRWVRGGTGLGIRAFGFVVSGLALWTGMALTVADHAWLWLFGMISLRLLADGALIASSALSVKRPRVLPMIIPAMIVLVATELVLPLLVLKKEVRWKDQVFTN